MKIYLASTSPRRQQLMREIGFEYEVVRPTSDEIEIPGESPKNMVRRLSREKALNVFQQLPKSDSPAILISADTTVVDPAGKAVLNKPEAVDLAKKMLRKISGRTHTVLTSYTILRIQAGVVRKSHTAIVRTRVKMRKLSSKQIADYVATGEPLDKAGAYGAQGIGMCLIDSIQGSYSNVIGLPMAELVIDLEKKFKVVPRWKK